jgi:magnesium transporter
MLKLYGCGTAGAIPLDTLQGSLPPHVDWIDAFDPSEEEVAFLRKTLGVDIPGLADLEEIETSSRLAVDGDFIVMSLPATARDETGFPQTTPIGFVLNKERVLTLRYARLPSFESLTKQLTEKGKIEKGGLGASVTILEIIVDHIADGLERIGGELDGVSRRVFAGDMISAKARKPRQTTETMKVLLQTIGRYGDLTSKMSESLLGLNRMIPFLIKHAAGYMTDDLRERFEVIGSDAKSLNDFEEHLANKTQFLLDTLLGLANIDQNNVFRVLTVVSVIGIPPTFFASMWGMNFKTMPELDWPHGYTMGLSVIILSAILPAVWFKVKGWW